MRPSLAAATALLCAVFLVSGAGVAGAGTGTAANVGIEKAAPSQVTAGETFDYVLTVRNAGPAAAVVTVVRDVLDARVRYVSSDPACSFVDGEVVCALGTLPPGQSRRIVVTVRAASALADGTVLHSYAVVGSLTFDDNRGDNGSSADVLVREPAELPDLSVRISGPKELLPGERGTYPLEVGNGGAAATSVVIRVRLDPVVRIVAVPNGCTLDVVRNQLECRRATFAPGERWEISLTAQAIPALPADTMARATAVVWSHEEDADSSDNSAGWTTRVPLPTGDLAVAVTGPKRISPATPYPFTITALNRGPDVVVGRLRGELAEGLRPDRLPPGCTSKGRVLTCELPALGVGERRELTVGVLPSPRLLAGSQPHNEFTLTPVRARDPDRSGNVAGLAPTVPPAVLRLAADIADVAPRPGSRLTMNVVLTNQPGAGAASDLVVFDRLPTGVSLETASARPGSVRQGQDGLLRWTIPELASGSSARLVLTMLVGPDVPAGARLVNQVWTRGVPVTRIISRPVAAPEPGSEPSRPTVRPSPAPPPRSTPEPEPTQTAGLAVVPAVPEPTVPAPASEFLLLGVPVIAMVVAVRLIFRK